MFLEDSLNFSYHIKEKMFKAMKGIGIIKKLSKTLPQYALITICKSFVRRHLDYGDIIYDQPNNESLKSKELNKMLLLQLQVPSEEYCRVNYVTN